MMFIKGDNAAYKFAGIPFMFNKLIYYWSPLTDEYSIFVILNAKKYKALVHFGNRYKIMNQETVCVCKNGGLLYLSYLIKL